MHTTNTASTYETKWAIVYCNFKGKEMLNTLTQSSDITNRYFIQLAADFIKLYYDHDPRQMSYV